MRDQLIVALGVLPAALRRTLTWDRGSEMAKHAEVTAALDAPRVAGPRKFFQQ
jgi:IS30 family transposase